MSPATVHPLRPRARKQRCACPERFTPEDLQRYLELAAERGYTQDQASWAWRTVRDWAHTNGRLRIDWVLVALNALRTGWGLRGFMAHRKELGREGRGRKLTAERIAALVERQRESGSP